ncbi:hypothetical protein FOZ62_004467, partial [Perkinsus olseni]
AQSGSATSPSNKQSGDGLLPTTGAKGGWESQQQQQAYPIEYQYAMPAANFANYPGYYPQGAYLVNYMTPQGPAVGVQMPTAYYNPQMGVMNTAAGGGMGMLASPSGSSNQGPRKNPNLRGGPRNPHNVGKGGKGKGFGGKGKGGKGAKGGASSNTSPASGRGTDTPTSTGGHKGGSATPEKKEDAKIDLSGPSLAVSAAILAAGKKLDKEALKHLEEEDERKEAERKKEEEEKESAGDKPKVMNWAAKLKASSTGSPAPKVVVAKTPTVVVTATTAHRQPQQHPTAAPMAAKTTVTPPSPAKHEESSKPKEEEPAAAAATKGPSWADRAKQAHIAPPTISPLVVTTKSPLVAATKPAAVPTASPAVSHTATPAAAVHTPRTVVATSPSLPKPTAVPAADQQPEKLTTSPPVSPRRLKGAWAARASRTPVTKPADIAAPAAASASSEQPVRASALTAAADLAKAKAEKEEAERMKAKEEADKAEALRKAEEEQERKEEEARKKEEEEKQRVLEEEKAEAEAAAKKAEAEAAAKKAAEEAAAAKKAAEEAAAKKAAEEEAFRKAAEDERIAKEKKEKEAAAAAAALKKAEEEEAAKVEGRYTPITSLMGSAGNMSAEKAAAAARESEESEKTAREENEEEEVTASEGYSQQQQEEEEEEEDDGYTPSPTPNYDAVLDYQHYTLDFLRSLRDLPECQELPKDHNIPAQILKNSRLGHMRNHKGDDDGMDWRKDAEKHRSMRHKDGRRKGGKSGRHGGDRRPASDPNEYVEPLEHSESSWATQQKLKLEQSDDEKVERHIIGILNKLTVEKFEKLVNELQSPETGICKEKHVKSLVDKLFEKATTQHHFIPMYADVCQRTVQWLKTSEEPVLKDVEPGKPQVMAFKNVLLNTCQSNFESNLRPPVELIESGLEGEELQEAEIRYKTRMLGNIKLVAQLLKRKLIHAKIIVVCVNQMWEVPREECIEALCVFLREIAPVYDDPKWSHYPEFAPTFDKLKRVTAEGSGYSSRIRFMCEDILDLRAHRWVDPKKDNGPLTISEVHRQVELERAETESKFTRQNSRGGGRGGLTRSRTGFGSSSKLDKKGSGLHRSVSRAGSVPFGLSATASRPGTRGSLPAAPTPAPWAARTASAVHETRSRSVERSSSPSSGSMSASESKPAAPAAPTHTEDPVKQVKSTLEELSASLDVNNAVHELADISATPEQQTKILIDRIGASCDIKREQRQAHYEAFGKLFGSEKHGTWDVSALEKALDEFADPEIIEDMKLDIPNIADIFVMELVKTLEDANVFNDDKMATYAKRLNVNV